MEATLEQNVIEDEWRGLYGDSWTGVVPEAFAHPAKYSRALIRHIYQHVIDCGWIHPGESVVDSFGGVALGGLDAMRHGLVWYGVELESKFHLLGNQNIALWNDRYSRMPRWGTAQLIQGDSRELASVLSEARIAVSSPPYADGCRQTGGLDPQPHYVQSGNKDVLREYGTSEGQLGAMKEGDLNLAISSPPYSESMNRAGGIDPEKSEHSYGPHSQMNRSDTRYGATDGQLGSMKEGSFDCAVTSPKGGDRSEGNLETMDAEGFQAAVTSPPYEGPQVGTGEGDRRGWRGYTDNGGGTYAQDGQISALPAADFWSASRVILEQLYQVLTPGAHAVFVVKAFVRNKQIVDFPGQWAQLCEAVGFKLLHDHHALLTEEHGTQTTFSGEDKTLTIARKSFFRRLAESKGSPKIDYENVLCFEKETP